MTTGNQIRVVKGNSIFGIFAVYENGRMDSSRSWVTTPAQDLVTITDRLFAGKKQMFYFFRFQIEPAAWGKRDVFARMSTFDPLGYGNDYDGLESHLKFRINLDVDESLLDHLIESGWGGTKELIKQLSGEENLSGNPFLFLWRLIDSTTGSLVRRGGKARLFAVRRKRHSFQSFARGLAIAMREELPSRRGSLCWSEKTTLYHVGLEIEEETDKLMGLLPFVLHTEVKHKIYTEAKHKTDEISLLYTDIEPLSIFYKPDAISMYFRSDCGGFSATIHPDKVVGELENICGDRPPITEWVETREETSPLISGVQKAIERARQHCPQMFYSHPLG